MEPAPLEVRAPKGARLMEIEWSDGATSLLPHSVLRGFCPCAVCQGHHAGPVAWVEPPEDESGVTLSDLAESGQYALRLEWGDGHRTGIYTFGFLRELGSLFELDAQTRRARTFGR